MLESAISQDLDIKSSAFMVFRRRAAALAELWENPALQALLAEDPFLFSKCPLRYVHENLEKISGIPPGLLKAWLISFPIEPAEIGEEQSRQRTKNREFHIHVGNYLLQGGRSVFLYVAMTGSARQRGIEAAKRLIEEGAEADWIHYEVTEMFDNPEPTPEEIERRIVNYNRYLDDYYSPQGTDQEERSGLIPPDSMLSQAVLDRASRAQSSTPHDTQ